MRDTPVVPSLGSLFHGFCSIGICGFGGVLPWAWRMVMPVTAGLVMAATAMLIETTSRGWRTAALTAAVTVLFLATRVHPLLVLAAAAALGASGVLG